MIYIFLFNTNANIYTFFNYLFICSEDEITRIKRKHKRKRNKHKKDAEHAKESGGYETVKFVTDESPTVPGEPKQDSGSISGRVAEQETLRGPGLERRMTDLEQNTKQQLQTIETLLRNVMNTRGRLHSISLLRIIIIYLFLQHIIKCIKIILPKIVYTQTLKGKYL